MPDYDDPLTAHRRRHPLDDLPNGTPATEEHALTAVKVYEIYAAASRAHGRTYIARGNAWTEFRQLADSGVDLETVRRCAEAYHALTREQLEELGLKHRCPAVFVEWFGELESGEIHGRLAPKDEMPRPKRFAPEPRRERTPITPELQAKFDEIEARQAAWRAAHPARQRLA